MRTSDALSDYLEVRGASRAAVTMLGQALLAMQSGRAPSARRATARLSIQLVWHEQRLGLPTAGAHADRGLAILAPGEDAALPRALTTLAAARELSLRPAALVGA